MEELGSHWKDFYRILYLRGFRKGAEKIPVVLKSDKSNGYFILRPIYIYGNIFLNNSHNIQTKTVEKNTHFMLNVEKNGGARQSTDDDITRRIHSPCQITKARTHTHSEYVIIIALL